jgi:hypothetical protein
LYGIIGLYGTTLLNKNYKGPILKLTNINYGYQKDENGKKEFLLYYNTKNYFYYDKNNDYIQFVPDLSKIPYYFVNMIYDQSGNNYDFVYKRYDNKYQPEFKIDNNSGIGYIIFESRNILFLDKPINNKQMRITAKIKVNKLNPDNSLNANYKKVQSAGYMNLLSTYSSPIVKLNINKLADNVQDTYNIDIQPDNVPNQKTKNDNYKIFTSTTYKTGTVVTANIDIDVKNTGIETLGSIQDDRTEQDLLNARPGPTGKLRDADGALLADRITSHNFIGNLYEIYIYDRTKL